MEVLQIQLSADRPIADQLDTLKSLSPHLLLAFGAIDRMAARDWLPELRAAFPTAELAGCSASGEISEQGLADGQLVLTGIRFDAPGLYSASVDVTDPADSRSAGERLGRALAARGAVHSALVFAPGVGISGTQLIEGLQCGLGGNVELSGALGGDGGAFQRSLTVCADGVFEQRVVAVGFDSPRVRLRRGCSHGWRAFGPQRSVTRADGRRLLELDGEPALSTYKQYLGEHARDLPMSALLFPFELLAEASDSAGLIRTPLAVDESDGSLTLAGDVEVGNSLRLMHGTTDSLVEGAMTAAQQARAEAAGESVALLVSCVGRKIVMGRRADEEFEAARSVFGADTTIAGLYAHGGISPAPHTADCKLHNQSVIVTHLTEMPA